ncbi:MULTISPECIES: type II toxin-antitoxin system RelE family toxin [Actinomycetaceae]|uniref:type II toxin-antitoxin system RelE family toxin n=1 Tax=Actinomycetaceae TaxID=2049 RepID=UPI000273312D|nr:type II toxin-antitoxin system RelE/ParE family toxin [Actinomyces sp. ICM47]EJG15811.1 addiction module toxin, RelE/StbE family [Actinomyces sp. ICM47]
MAWKAKLSPRALKQLSKLDKPAAARIIAYLRETANGNDPRARGKALTGNLAGFWRYRVGDYRIIVSIEDDELLILAINIDHRSRVYR